MCHEVAVSSQWIKFCLQGVFKMKVLTESHLKIKWKKSDGVLTPPPFASVGTRCQQFNRSPVLATRCHQQGVPVQSGLSWASLNISRGRVPGEVGRAKREERGLGRGGSLYLEVQCNMFKKLTKTQVTNFKSTIAQLRTTFNTWMNYNSLFYKLIDLAKMSHGNFERKQIN